MCHGIKVKDSAEEFIDKLISTINISNVANGWVDVDYRPMNDLINIAQCCAKRLRDKDRLKKLIKLEKKFSTDVNK